VRRFQPWLLVADIIRRLRDNRWLSGLLFLIGLALLIVLTTSWQPVVSILSGFENLLTDARLRLRATQLVPSPDIVIIANDDLTSNLAPYYPELGMDQQMMPRTRVAEIVDYARREGARAVVLDVMFSRPSSRLEEDRALADAIRRAGNVTVVTTLDNPKPADESLQGSEQQALTNVSQALTLWGDYGRRRAWYWRTMPDPGFVGLRNISGMATLANVSIDSQRYGLSQGVDVRQALLTNASKTPSLHERLSEACLVTQYERLFQKTPDFLAALAANRSTLRISEDWSVRALDAKSYCTIRPVHSPILRGARSLGMTKVEYSREGTFLREVPGFYIGYRGYPYLYVGVQEGARLRGLRQGEISPQAIHLGALRIPLSTAGRFYINWRDPARLADQIAGQRAHRDETTIRRLLGGGHLYRVIPAIDVLLRSRHAPLPVQSGGLYNIPKRPESGLLSLKDKVVIYGDTLRDIHSTPMGPTIFGPEVLATVLDSIWHDDTFVEEASVGVQAGLMLALAGLSFLIVSRSRRLSIGLLLTLGLWAGYGALNVSIFVAAGFLLPLLSVLLAGFYGAVASLLRRYYEQDREKRQITDVFANYVSPQILDTILEDPSNALKNLRGRKSQLTVLFADLQNFTHIFEQAEPEAMVDQLNAYFDSMTQVILAHGGTCDKYMGDAIMAFFGAPLPMSDHAARACQAAQAMQVALQALNLQWQAEGRAPLRQGVGLSTGPMFVGNFGSQRLKNFTVMGRCVNLGARLEALTRDLGQQILISEETARQAKEHLPSLKLQDCGEHRLKGFSEPARVFAVMDMAPSERESQSA
jgi:class 3 adenylate cyclase/CHASE2 domain-containing sensor protein